jgi:hypothetical protein
MTATHSRPTLPHGAATLGNLIAQVNLALRRLLCVARSCGEPLPDAPMRSIARRVTALPKSYPATGTQQARSGFTFASRKFDCAGRLFDAAAWSI